MTKRAAPPHVAAASLNRRRLLAGAAAVTGVAAAGATGRVRAGTGSLQLYSWRDYTGKAVLSDFQASTGISASADFYDSSDEMFRTIDAANKRYDVLIASYDYVEHMIGRGLLQTLDHGKLPNMENLFPVFRDARFDPGHRYSLPYLWGTQGICFRKSAVKTTPASWGVLLDSDTYSGRISLPGADTLGVALKYLGYSYNSVDRDEVKAAGELIIRQKPHVASFGATDGVELLANGEVDVAIGWNTEILGLMDKDDDIDYRVPVEGGLLWQDCMCIPASATNAEDAHTLINYALEAQVGAKIAESFWYATPNQAALAFLSDAYRADHTIFPGMDVIKQCEPALNLGEAGTRLRLQIWGEVTKA
jgi:spermidine/putrescine transport system substrate-binding protein